MGSHTFGYFVSILTIVLTSNCSYCVKYEPNWDSLDSRPLPTWYDEGKIGIFLHWGIFSVPSFGSEWFWISWEQGSKKIEAYMKKNYKPDFTYQDFAPDFTVDLFNPNDWADLFQDAGAKYVVLTTKHHEGFTNWPSNHSFSWNAMDVGPKRDLVGELSTAIRKKTDIHFGVYHSMFEWFNPVFLNDQKNGFHTRNFPQSKAIPELYELVNNYQPDVIWSDGAVGADTYWKSPEFLAWLYNDSPVKDTVVVNDRWGNNTSCKHGGFLSCSDRYNPGKLQKRKWENAFTIDMNSWGHRRDAVLSQLLTMEEIMAQLVSTISCGGNVLINVGPTKDGRIVPIFEERLRDLGAWLKLNGEAIYSTRPWTYQNDTVTPHVWYTAKKSSQGGLSVYATLLRWPDPGNLFLGSPTPTSSTRVTLLGYEGKLNWSQASTAQGINVNIPLIPFNRMPCKYAWVLKFDNLA
ncbi:alpha-L-fucosidase-like isoform X2 [Mya arenaria]|uniref:alpha-L-fucosidase-like isoform X2 n=1 Tax=Mya arenaria TaxID=6604 RepID=UPI0022E6F4A6|nr:alpha-L-fucosidase-like isoform X2 [Mya arenaria]